MQQPRAIAAGEELAQVAENRFEAEETDVRAAPGAGGTVVVVDAPGGRFNEIQSYAARLGFKLDGRTGSGYEFKYTG